MRPFAGFIRSFPIIFLGPSALNESLHEARRAAFLVTSFRFHFI
jgi:hypothetical protein